MFLQLAHEIEIGGIILFSRKLNVSYKYGLQCQWQHQFREYLTMNNILIFSIGLLAVTAMGCAYRPLVNYGGDVPMRGGQPAGTHVSQTESKSNFWSRTISRQRREALPQRGPGGPGGPHQDLLYVFEWKRCEFSSRLINSCFAHERKISTVTGAATLRNRRKWTPTWKKWPHLLKRAWMKTNLVSICGHFWLEFECNVVIRRSSNLPGASGVFRVDSNSFSILVQMKSSLCSRKHVTVKISYNHGESFKQFHSRRNLPISQDKKWF